MESNILLSNILPASGIDEGIKTFQEKIESMMKEAHHVDIAVGYVSRNALLELDDWIHKYHVSYTRLIIGMYYIEGMPESSYHAALDLNSKWQSEGIGEIRLIKPFKYHGKAYLFYREDDYAIGAIIGSANLGAIKLEASNRRQYELALFTDVPMNTVPLKFHIDDMASDNCSANIADLPDIPIVREKNTALENIDLVSRVTETDVQQYEKAETEISFMLPIKVPAFDERFMDDNKHYTKSNLNVSYAAPRSARKSRDWYETQFTVSVEYRSMPGYPEKNVPFFVVTDDGYQFKAHTTSDNNKQFSAVGDELIMGRWIKGRLAAAGLVNPVNDTQLDRERLGMITKEMLEKYGCTALKLTKTNKKALDGDQLLDVWLLSFESANVTE